MNMEIALYTLRSLREEAGLKKENLAECLGISKKAFSDMEDGKRPFPSDFLEKLSTIFSHSVEDIISGEALKKEGIYPRNLLKSIDLSTAFLLNRIAQDSFEMDFLMSEII